MRRIRTDKAAVTTATTATTTATTLTTHYIPTEVAHEKKSTWSRTANRYCTFSKDWRPKPSRPCCESSTCTRRRNLTFYLNRTTPLRHRKRKRNRNCRADAPTNRKQSRVQKSRRDVICTDWCGRRRVLFSLLRSMSIFTLKTTRRKNTLAIERHICVTHHVEFVEFFTVGWWSPIPRAVTKEKIRQAGWGSRKTRYEKTKSKNLPIDCCGGGDNDTGRLCDRNLF